MSEDRCIVCGEIIPEGRMICWACEHTDWTSLEQEYQETETDMAEAS